MKNPNQQNIMAHSVHGLLLLPVLAMAAGCGKAGTSDRSQPIVVIKGGFATPESVLHDPQLDIYMVSNINGNPLEADDNGFISLVSTDGRILALKWIDGASDSVTLNAPKGMAVSEGSLYVADLTVIRRFDRKTGAPQGEVHVPGATFLNDVAAGEDGAIYFTDSGLKAGAGGLEPSGTDAVYRLWPNGTLDTLARGDSLGRPNGIALSGDSVWVVSFGSGELYRVVGGGRADVVKLPKGSLDGLVVVFGEVFASSWDGESIIRGPIGGPFHEFQIKLPAPADIGHDIWRNRILVPLFNANEVRILKLAL
jgi:sugar lactone lactonase YvrE